MKRPFLAASAAALLAVNVAGAASAYEMDSAGVGFVGKGEVQLAFGWNNRQLQDNAGSVEFTYDSIDVTEVSWTCTNSNNENLQERARTTTTTTSGVVDSVARERNQITGFNLTGFTESVVSGTETEGPTLNSCPSGPWSLTTPAGEPELVSSTGGLFVTFGGETKPLTVTETL